jgi:vacuolar-type H+-ATPase subunit H
MADILYLVERLEEVLAQGWRVPFSANAVIDEDAFIDIIEQMHIAIPIEIRQAQQIIQQKDRILAQAREESERMLEHAYQQAERLVTQTAVVERAQLRSKELRTLAWQEAEEIRQGADEYAGDVLARLRDELQAYLHQVDNGLERLKAQPPPSPPVAPPLEFNEEESDDFLTTEDGTEPQEGLLPQEATF